MIPFVGKTYPYGNNDDYDADVNLVERLHFVPAFFNEVECCTPNEYGHLGRNAVFYLGP